jgi:WD40 repeat protein
LRYFDIDKKTTVEVFPGKSQCGGVVDYDDHTLLGFCEQGLFLYDGESDIAKPLPLGLCGSSEAVCYRDVGRINFGPYRFFAFTYDDFALIKTDGSTATISEGIKRAWSSPDGNWLATQRDDHLGVAIFNSELKKFADLTLEGEKFYSLIWRPDSKGFFYHMDNRLFYYDISLEQVNEVDNGLDTGYLSFTITWVAG